jgi:nucleoside-triphosphatase
MLKIFFTGRPGCGKSTVVHQIVQVLKEKGLKVGGITTPEVREEGRRVAFRVKDVLTQAQGILASVWTMHGPRVSKYRVDVESFEKVALPALERALKECEVIVIDEIGAMELFSLKFKQKVHEVLTSDKVVLATLHRNYVTAYQRYGEVIEVTSQNRNKLPQQVLQKIKVT